MLKKLFIYSACATCAFNPLFSQANVIKKTFHNTELMLKQHVDLPFYFGAGVGYGNTDWKEITTAPGLTNLAAQGAPIGATSGGFAWGFMAGYQFSKHFTVEASYTRYPETTVDFEPEANNYNLLSLKTNTDTWSFLGKIMVPFGFTKLYVYADAGVTIVHRDDTDLTPIPGTTPLIGKTDKYKAGPSFGFGLAMNVTKRIFAETGFQYTTGFDKVTARPAQGYIPFVYSIMFNLGVRV